MIAVAVGLADLLTHPFMRHALLAGIPVAALSGLVGYFMVLRSQVFTGDALSHVAFSGALGALAIGINPRWGLFGATIAVGIALGLLGNRGRADDVVIGTVFAWVLGIGVLALSVYASTAHAAQSGAAGVSVLFGSILGLSLGQAVTAAVLSVALVGLVVAIGRPLLFATLDSAVAAARGVRVRPLDVGFLALVGATAALATQAVGALLLLGLLSAPAGAARRLTARPYVALWISSGLAVASMVVGLVVAYVVPSVPPSFAVVASAASAYVVAVLATLRPQRRTRSLSGSYIGRNDTVTG
jgi:zinc/manganese transport system permease protein